MDKTNTLELDPPPDRHDGLRIQARPKRRFGLVSALVRIAIAIAIVGAAGYAVYQMVSSRPEAPMRRNIERTFTVSAVEPVYGTYSASVLTYGVVTAARTIDLRAQVEGQVVEVSPDFAAGREVDEGQLLVRVDPYAYDGAVIEAEAAQADAELALAEARQAYALEQSNLEVAQASLAAAQNDLANARRLLESGAATQQSVDTAELTVSERQQAVNQSQTDLFTLEAGITRQQAAVAQAQYNVETARRDRANTEVTAPFTGIVTSAAATESGYISANEVLGTLYDTSALEVSFTVSDREYGTLAGAGLAGRPLSVTWNLETASVTVPGTISRSAPEVDAATGGVTLYAHLDTDAAAQLRPGTFVSVEIEGVAHENALRIPETAVYDDDHLYVIRDGRMAAIDVTILERDNAELIVAADIPEGERIITTRLSQAGEGVAVVVEGEEDEQSAGGSGDGPGGGAVVRGPGG
ncbi:efflux RND transporter periplasmic adaptor subunit [Pelagibacterium xiamenense]|uniref:efflux RND transporter periplasmic adaptor subunit n=1 Tax=Pelagibacterium xiamenense TaxID=2901140 RepID=UPI001E5C1452|nr:efflux RND transporter periplasmic adaptor subunit [Pelagibacterium xiamenense]MCD7058997.1 efflux RND transporter periplasmic adaptor subunit [Pelagibacterium xiamenense]